MRARPAASSCLPAVSTIDAFRPPPSLASWTLLVRLPSGQLMSADFLWTTARRWADRPEADDPGWTVQRIGCFLVAARFMV